MFKRNEESEWSRFSKAFTGKDEKDPEKQATDPGLEEETDVESPATSQSDPTPISGLSTARPALDTNLGLARPNAGSVTGVYSPDDVESTVGEHSSFDGTLRSESSIRIKGTAQGEIECSKAVFVEENAKVDAKITAASITVAGEVNGELTCGGRVEIRPSGRVTGTINAGTLVMQEGAFFDGNLRMRTSETAAAH